MQNQLFKRIRAIVLRFACYFFCLQIALFVPPTVRADTADDFLKGYILIQEADAAEKGGEKAVAVEKYAAALKILRKVARSSPDWNPNIITYRSKYCADHITKNGGKVESEEAELAAAQAAEPTPVNTVPSILDPVVPQPEKLPVEKPVAEKPPVVAAEPPPVEKPAPVDSSTSLERELEKAYAEVHDASEPETGDSEVADLKKRLRKAEDQLRAVLNLGDERIQALTRENRSLKADLADLQGQMQSLQRDYDGLKTEREALKRDLEKTQLQLKTTLAKGVSSEELQTLRRENSLLRAITERQYQEEQKRIEAGKRVAKYVQELESQLETLVRPTTFSDQELAVMKNSSSKEKEEESGKGDGGDTRLVGKIKAEGESRGGFVGKILQVNTKDNFVIVNYQPGEVPPVGTVLTVYRGDSVVGTVKVANPSKPPVAPAEIIKGSVRKGDVVRTAAE